MSTTFPAELYQAFSILLRTFGFLLPFSELRRQLGALNFAALVLAISIGAVHISTLLSGTLRAGAIGNIEVSELVLNGLSELLFGLTLGAPFGVVLSVLLSGGRIVDLLRGNLLAEQLLPGLEERASALEAALTLGFLTVSLSGAAAIGSIALLYDSIVRAPEAKLFLFPDTTFSLSQFVQSVFRELVRFFGPVAGSLFAFELLCAGIGRACPKAAVQTELAALKLVVGLGLLLCLSWNGLRTGQLLDSAKLLSERSFRAVGQ